jgi:hypothetical protein
MTSKRNKLKQQNEKYKTIEQDITHTHTHTHKQSCKKAKDLMKKKKYHKSTTTTTTKQE